jgi:hypothetical protein
MVDLPCIDQLHQRRYLIVLHFSNNDQSQFSTRLCRIVCKMPGSWLAASAIDLQSCKLKFTQREETKNYHNIAGPGNFTNYKTYKIFDGRELIPDMGSLFLTLEMITFSS